MRALVGALLAVLAAPAPALAEVELRVLSGRADLVSGGDALVEIRGAEPGAVQVDAGRRDVTSAFARRPGGRLAGLVTGLPVGRTVLTARVPDGSGARLELTNHPRSGPVIAGPQTQPWLCDTEAAGLEPARDASCAAPTRIDYVYKSTRPGGTGGFGAYDPAAPPSDVATTTTDDGREVPFIVRVETGVMDRAIYKVAVLSDPARSWSPWAPQPGWTGKVLWPFGGDCKPFHRQDTPVDPVPYTIDPDTGGAVNPGADEALGGIFGNGNAPAALARGFMVATSANNKLGSQCNTVVSAEAILMLKEHIAETYGPIRYVIGAGGSGGAMQQQQIASAYPGLLDGLQPLASFPDVWSVVDEAQDCHLLTHYFDAVSPHLWAAAPQRDAVTGTMGQAGCRVMFDFPVQTGLGPLGGYAGMWLDPTNAIGCSLPAEQVYDPETNRGGVRCTLPDYMRSIFGRRPSDGFANRPFDNTGVQYGLRALQSGRITAEQFVDLNEKVGGIDIDWRFQAARSVADRPALDVAYRASLVTHGRELAKVPIIDIRGQDNYEIHADFHSYSLRERLERANGHHDNQVIFTGARAQVGDPESFQRAFTLVDEWLERVDHDRSARPLAEKVRRNRPAAAVDTCWFEGRAVTDQATCRALFPYFGDPRIAAGGPLADDVLKCALRPLDRAGYGEATFSDEQWARLRAAFPDGVCDYTRPGAGQRPPQAWMTFAGGPGGRPLGTEPRSRPIVNR